MGSFAVQQDLFDHSADVDGAVLTGTAAIDLLEGALDLDRPTDLAMFNAPFQPARTAHQIAFAPPLVLTSPSGITIRPRNHPAGRHAGTSSRP
jgi:hypothetical protein